MKTIVIIGGGFAGLEAAKRLSERMWVKPWGRRLRNWLAFLTLGLVRRVPYERRLRIVLFSSENHTIFTPLLTEVVGASISPLHVVWPLRQMLPGVECLTARVTHLHTDQNRVTYRLPDGRDNSARYDHLVIACGSQVNMTLLPGMAAHGMPLKTLGDAFQLRNHVIGCLEEAEVEIDLEVKKRLLTIVVIGGGFSGVEVAGEMLDLVKNCSRYYPSFGPNDVNVYLLHSREFLLPELPESLGVFAREKLEGRGLNVRMNTRAQAITPTDVRLSTGETIPAATVVCTIGNTPLDLIVNSDLPQQKGWIESEGTLRARGMENVWAIGDCAIVPNAAADGDRSPGTAQFAVRHAKHLAKNLEAAMNGGELTPFAYKNRGMFASIGHHTAVGQIEMFVRVKLSGFVAWFLWRAFYLSKMPTLARKFQISLDWFWNMFFPPDLVQVSTEPTGRLPKAHYEPGQYLFHKGDPADALYVIERGKAGVYIDEDERPVAILKAGDHFGERGLMGAGTRTASVRAEEPLDVIRIGKGSFDELLGTVDFFRARMEGVINRIDALGELGRHHGGGQALKDVLVGDVMLRNLATVADSATFGDARQKADRDHMGAVVVVDADDKMVGICTRSDIHNGALKWPDATPVTRVMTDHVHSVRTSDPLSAAMYQFLKEPIKRLVVLADDDSGRPVGWVTPFEILPYMGETFNGKESMPAGRSKEQAEVAVAR